MNVWLAAAVLICEYVNQVARTELDHLWRISSFNNRQRKMRITESEKAKDNRYKTGGWICDYNCTKTNRCEIFLENVQLLNWMYFCWLSGNVLPLALVIREDRTEIFQISRIGHPHRCWQIRIRKKQFQSVLSISIGIALQMENTTITVQFSLDMKHMSTFTWIHFVLCSIACWSVKRVAIRP